MHADEQRKIVLEKLSVALGELLAIGLHDLPEKAQEVVAQRVAEHGFRVGFTVLLAPMELICQISTADLSERVELFRVETGPISEHGSMH